MEARGPQNWIPENLIQSMLRNLTETHTNSNFSNNRSAEGVLLEISLPIVTAHEYERSQLKSIRILVVEDDDDIRELIVETLSRAGYSVGSAVNGQEAIEQFHAHRPSLVLTDIYMPVLDGIALAEQIKKLEPNMPIIVFSGQYTNLLQDRIDGILKCDHVLYKPFAQKDVLESVHLLT